MKKIIGLMTPMLLLLAACAQTTFDHPGSISTPAKEIHFDNAKRNHFAMTLLESANQKKKFPGLQDQLNTHVIVDLPLYAGSTPDSGPWKGSVSIIYNVFGKTSQAEYDAPVPLAQAKQWFQQEMSSEGYQSFGGGPDFTLWQYGKDPNLYVDVELLDKGNGKTLVEYGVSYDPIPQRPSSTLLTDPVLAAEIQVSGNRSVTKDKKISNPSDLKKIVDLYNALPLSGDDGNHSRPAILNAESIEIKFTESGGKTVEVSEDPYGLVQSGNYTYFDKQKRFAMVIDEYVGDSGGHGAVAPIQ